MDNTILRMHTIFTDCTSTIMALGRFVCRLNRLHIIVLALVILVSMVCIIKQVHEIDRIAGPYGNSYSAERQLHSNYNYDSSDLVYYKKDVPLVWIGGVPRSGTTLMRAMLDAHRDIRCGEETRVIPRVLGMHTGMQKSRIEMARLQEARIDDDVLDQALGAYILSIIAKHGEPAPRLCNKDPFTLRSMSRLLRMFPSSKFILMIRDGRATAHSIISRHVTIKGFDISSYRGALKDWNKAMVGMYGECQHHGLSVCLPVFYEQLVLHPERELRRILAFLHIPWDDMVLHHERAIGKDKGVSLSRRELSTDQVDKPVNTRALTAWAKHIPKDVRRDMAILAPMLKTLGYDPEAYPPDYGTPDPQVLKNTQQLAPVGNRSQPRVNVGYDGDSDEQAWDDSVHL